MKQPKKKKIKFFIPILILCMLLLFVGMLCFFAAEWYKTVYGDVGFDSILYTLLSDLGGVESDLIMEFVKDALLPAILLTVLVGLALLHFRNKREILSTFILNLWRLPFYLRNLVAETMLTLSLNNMN